MPKIRNLDLIKRFTDYFKLKFTDSLDSEAGRTLIPVVTLPIPVKILKVIDLVLNDSDKTITVPSGKQWRVLYGAVVFTTSAVAGNRRILVVFNDDSANETWRTGAVNTQAASTTERYNLQSGGVSVTEDVAAIHIIPIPKDAILEENNTIRIFDAFAVDAAADDMLVNLVVEETDITGE